jgi:hypothetical protein
VAGGSRCFCCFSRKLSASDISVSAEILDRQRFGERQNSEMARCFSAVFRCLRNTDATVA